MDSDTTEPERQAFEILELIDALHDAPWCQSSVCGGQNIEKLLDDLEDSYRYAMEPWSEHRTTPGELFQEDFYRWHEYMFPPDIYQQARRRFTELATTSRFSVEEEPCLFDLEQVNSPSDKITTRHIVSLAALVCIQFALQELESLKFLDAQKVSELFSEKIKSARGLQRQADLWLAHLATLNHTKREFDFERNFERTKQREQSRLAAKKPRKVSTKELTAEIVANFWKERSGQKWERIRNELHEKFKVGDTYTVSERTIARRYSEAQKKNLVP